MRMRKTKTRRPAPHLEWLREASGGEARISLVGRDRALVENHTGIVEFTPERVRLTAKKGEIAVLGQALQLHEVRPGALIVRGVISGVLLPGAEDAAYD